MRSLGFSDFFTEFSLVVLYRTNLSEHSSLQGIKAKHLIQFYVGQDFVKTFRDWKQMDKNMYFSIFNYAFSIDLAQVLTRVNLAQV